MNDDVFTDVVMRVFGLLAAATASESPAAMAGGQGGQQQQQRAGVDADYRPKIHLSMTARCVSDIEDLEAREYRRRVYGPTHTDIFEARYESSYLDLRLAAGKSVQDEAEALPELYCIKQFYVQATAGPRLRHFAPRALSLVASRMLGLESVHWELCDNEKRDIGLRKRLRADFAYTLQTLPSSLRHFNLLYDRRLPLDHALLLAAARAVRRMPALWMMHFVLEPPVGNIGELEVEYMIKAGTGGGGGRTAELVVESHPMFHPDEEVVQIWREAAEEHAGAEFGFVVVVRDSRAW